MSKRMQQAQDLWDSVKTETDQDNKRLKMAKFALLLLNYAAPDAPQFEEMAQKDRLTDFFMEYLEIGEQCAAFFDSALPHIDPEFKAAEFEQDIQDAKQNLQKISAQSAAFKRQYAELLEQEKRLKKESAQLQLLEATLAELKALEERLKPENMAALEDEIAALQTEIELDLKKAERMEEEQQAAQAKLELLQTILRELQSRLTNDLERIITHSKQLADALDESWDVADRRLEKEAVRLRRKNRAFKDVTEKLDACLKELKTATDAEKNNRQIYTAHFAADAAAADAIRTSPDSGQNLTDAGLNARMASVADISKQIDALLNSFDSELRDVVKSEEETVLKIRRLNKSG